MFNYEVQGPHRKALLKNSNHIQKDQRVLLVSTVSPHYLRIVLLEDRPFY